MSHGSVYIPIVSLLGDSIDHGFGADALLAGYGETVYRSAATDQNPFFFVGITSTPGIGNTFAVDPWNDAVNGASLGTFPSPGLRPDIILAGGGTNNVGAGQSAATVLASFSGVLDSWYNYLRFKSWGRIVFRNILLRNDASSGTYNPIITTINAGLQGVINGKAYAAQVTVADVASAVNPLTQLNADGLHPVNSGFASMAVPIYAALKPAILSVKAAAGVG